MPAQPGRLRTTSEPPLSDGAERTLTAVPPPELTLGGFEASLPHLTIEQLERLALDLADPWLAERFDRRSATREGVLLRTCCRRELLVLVREPAELERWQDELPGPPGAWVVRSGRDVVRHLYRVAGGQESLAVGEAEVRTQVRSAASDVVSRHRARALRDLLQGAARAADHLAPHVPAARSVAAIAATRVLELCGRPFPRVLVVGAGTVGRQVTEWLGPSARVTLAYHHRPPEPGFLRAAGARAVSDDALAAEIAVSDVVVTATKSGGRCLRPRDLPRDRSLILVDLGVPRNIDPAVRSIRTVRLIDLTDLRPSLPTADEGLGRRLEASADGAFDRLERAALEPWVAAVRRSAEDLRAAELAVARPFLGSLTAEQEVAVDRLTRRLVDRILRPASERLREIPPGEEGNRLRRFALELLGPKPDP